MQEVLGSRSKQYDPHLKIQVHMDTLCLWVLHQYGGRQPIPKQWQCLGLSRGSKGGRGLQWVSVLVEGQVFIAIAGSSTGKASLGTSSLSRH